jgi:aspartyl-tRNA synthetase
MKNEIKKGLLIAYAVLATIVAGAAIFSMHSQVQKTQTSQVTVSHVAKSNTAHASSSSKETTPIKSSSKSSSDPYAASLEDKALKFTQINTEFYADQKQKHDQLQRLSTSTVADKLVPNQNKITNAAVLEQSRYSVKWVKLVPMLEPGTSDSRTVTVHLQFVASNDATHRQQDYLLRLDFIGGQIHSYQYYDVKESQS